MRNTCHTAAAKPNLATGRAPHLRHGWHLPWLEERVGEAAHHVVPGQVAVLPALQAARQHQTAISRDA